MTSTTIPILDENLQLHHFSLSKHEANAAIIARMCGLSIENSPTAHGLVNKIMHALLIREPAVGKGLVLKLSDLEAQANSPQHVHEIKKDDTLTKLIFGSEPISENGSLYAYLIDDVQDIHAGYTVVWCFYYAVSGRKASAWLLIALGLAVLLGFGVGVGAGDGQLGLDAGASALAVLTVIHLSVFLGMMYQ